MGIAHCALTDHIGENQFRIAIKGNERVLIADEPIIFPGVLLLAFDEAPNPSALTKNDPFVLG